jgi:hypothetical protein
MIVLLDRGLSSNALLTAITGTGAGFLARLSATRKPPVLRRLPDGSAATSWTTCYPHAACASAPRRQAPAVALRLQKPARGPAHLQGNDQHRHLDEPAQPLTTRPWAKGR